MRTTMVGIIIVTGILLLSSHHLLLAEASLIAEPPFTVVWSRIIDDGRPDVNDPQPERAQQMIAAQDAPPMILRETVPLGKARRPLVKAYPVYPDGSHLLSWSWQLDTPTASFPPWLHYMAPYHNSPKNLCGFELRAPPSVFCNATLPAPLRRFDLQFSGFANFALPPSPEHTDSPSLQCPPHIHPDAWWRFLTQGGMGAFRHLVIQTAQTMHLAVEIAVDCPPPSLPSSSPPLPPPPAAAPAQLVPDLPSTGVSFYWFVFVLVAIAGVVHHVFSAKPSTHHPIVVPSHLSPNSFATYKIL